VGHSDNVLPAFKAGCSAALEKAAGQVIYTSNGTRWPSGKYLGHHSDWTGCDFSAVIANACDVRTLAQLAKTIKAAQE